MFKKARDIIIEQCRLGARPSDIRKKLRSETSLSMGEISAMISELLPAEDKKKAQAIIQEMINDSGLPENMARDMLLTGGRTKTIAALRTAIRRRLKKETRLTFADINEMVGLEKNSHHLSEDAMG
jgi:cell division ATPase FtsA